MAVSAPLLFHGSQPVQVPQALSKASAVYVRVDAVRPPLQRPYEGPFPVISRTDKTFCLRRNGKDWNVSVDSLKAAASSFPLTHLPSSPPVDDDDGPPSRSPPPDLGAIGPPPSPVALGPRPLPAPAERPGSPLVRDDADAAQEAPIFPNDAPDLPGPSSRRSGYARGRPVRP